MEIWPNPVDTRAFFEGLTRLIAAWILRVMPNRRRQYMAEINAYLHGAWWKALGGLLTEDEDESYFFLGHETFLSLANLGVVEASGRNS